MHTGLKGPPFLYPALTAQEWGPPVLRATQAAGSTDFAGGVDLLEAAIAAVDGEKDPRCLLISFRLLRVSVPMRVRVSAC